MTTEHTEGRKLFLFLLTTKDGEVSDVPRGEAFSHSYLVKPIIFSFLSSQRDGVTVQEASGWGAARYGLVS